MSVATLRRLVPVAVLAVAFGWLAAGAQGGDDGFKPLFNGKNLKGWKAVFKGEQSDPEKTFVVKDGVIHVTGDPFGYIYTAKPYSNYVLRYTWRYPKDQPEKTTMNSGCLIHIQKADKVWPQSVEPQCRYMDHGKLFFIGLNAKEHMTSQKFDEKAQKEALKPSYEWNTTEVTAKGDGSIEVRINGELVTTGQSTLTEGPIGFQSEGAIIEFKDIQIKQMK